MVKVQESVLQCVLTCSDYHPDGPLPVYEEAVNLLQEGVVKVDHFENIYRLPKKFEGAPNWRQAIGSFNN